MKVRSGFVSNSSSSSFVVASKDGKVKITFEVDLERLINRRGQTIKTIEEFEDWLQKDRCWRYEYWEDNPLLIEYHRKAKEAFDKGQIIYIGSCYSDAGDAVEEFLCLNGFENVVDDDENNTVIEGHGGF